MQTSTQIFDDGSTLTYSDTQGYYQATPAEADGINTSVAGWSPQMANPRASSWEEVIQLGFARTIDAITRPLELTNTQAVLQRPVESRWAAGAPIMPAGMSPGTVVLGALVLVALLWMANR